MRKFLHRNFGRNTSKTLQYSTAFSQNSYRITQNVITGFNADECSEKASALTFYSLLSIVPILAVAFGIARGFGFEENLQYELTQKFIDQREVIEKLISFAQSMLKSTQSGIIAGVGLVVLLWSVLKLFGNIESSFNAIWRIKHQRSFTRKISDYFAMMLLCPIFFAVSSSLSVFVFTHLSTLTQGNGLLQKMSPFLITGYHLFPFILSWFLFSAIYYVMPNTHVPLKYACIAGIIAGTAYQIIQWTYIQFQLGLSSYGAIYGSFAALPLFLIWLNTSWITTLAGAEIAYHTQQDSMFRDMTKPNRNSTLGDGRVLSLLIMQEALLAFFSGNKAPDIEALSTQVGATSDAIESHVEMMLQKGLLSKVFVGDHTKIGYQPGRDPNLITVKAVCDAVDTARDEQYVVSESDVVHRYEQVLSSLDAIVATTMVNQPLRSFFIDAKQKS